MNLSKISVLIPMYNRKQCIEQCIDSVLNQTFQDFEIIVCDDGSIDGSADFVENRYLDEISLGKIKLLRNKENIGQFPTDNRLLAASTSKYVMLLHSDDVYLPNALEHMYTVAEKFNADVVHSSVRFKTDRDGILKEDTKLKIAFDRKLHHFYNNNNVDKSIVISNDPQVRFDEWLSGTHVDAPYNIFRREFLTDNNISFVDFGNGLTGENRFFALKWIMKAKVFIKTFEPFYIWRDYSDSLTNAVFPLERVAEFIDAQIELSRNLDEFFTHDDFFKENPDYQYRARSRMFSAFDDWWIKRNLIYKKGVTDELNKIVENVFKKYFGNDYALPTFLFHWVHCLALKSPVDKIITHNQSKS